MIIQERSLELLGAVEEALAGHRAFGDSTYIFGRLKECMAHRLDAISADLPAAGELLKALAGEDGDAPHPVLADTVLRCAVLRAHAQVGDGVPQGVSPGLTLADCAEVFAAAARRLERGGTGTPLDDGSLARLGTAGYHGWLWNADHPDDVFGRSYRRLLKNRYDALPLTFEDEAAETLRRGARLLEELLPSLAPSALRHAQLIACVPDAGGWSGVASSSQFHLGGTIFLGRSLQSPWWVAEHLFHEALHQKLYDFRHGHLLMDLDYALTGTRTTVCSPWNPPRFNKANHWDVHRVFAAFHVYVHVALLALVAERRAPELEGAYGPFHGMIDSGRALGRARYLGEKLTDLCWDHLGVAGRRMVDWLMSVLAHLDPSPAPRGATFHLCLDLYEKEAAKTAAALDKAGPAPSVLARRLAPLAKEEVEDARGLLAAMGAGEELRRFGGTVARYTDEELGLRFPELRRDIAAALVASSAGPYRLTESGRHDELFLRMTQSASVRLSTALAGYPPAVGAAKLRESELRFGMSCADQVGRLLAVLAAAMPVNGRILEIGTGVGVGTAWIATGLGERTDVEVISVEAHGGLSDAARKGQWPAGVEFVTADAVEVLPTLGTFDLVFADAAPVKYGHLASVLETLRPGGLLAIDDLDSGPSTSQDQCDEKEALRRSLLHHPELHAVEIAGSTGVLLAARSAPHGAGEPGRTS